MLYREITFDYLLQAVRRRKLAILAPATAITIGVCIFALLLPNIYRADTLILVEPKQSVESQGGKPSIQVSMERDRLDNISQQILSRNHLEQIINQFNLYGGLPMEQRVEEMREAIKLELEHPDQTANISSFRIFFQHRDARLATDVANRLASLFIDENTSERERMAGERAHFLEDQLAQTKAKLDEDEKKIEDFKQKHLGVLPEERDANLKMMEQLNAQLVANNDAINRAEQQRVYLEAMLAQYQSAPKSVRQQIQRPGEAPIGKTQSAVEKQLDDLKAHLVELRSKYTDQHPDVIHTANQIAELEVKHKAEMASSSTSNNSNSNGSTVTSTAADAAPELFMTTAQVTSQLRSVKAELEERGKEQAKLQSQLNNYQARLELSPTLDQELSNLTREYNVTKENYVALSNEKLSSQMAEDLERKQKAMLFRVVDPAKLPEKPYRPDRRSISLFGLLAGIAMGFGFAFYREFTDESLRTEKEIETALGLDVLAVVPKVTQ